MELSPEQKKQLDITLDNLTLFYSLGREKMVKLLAAIDQKKSDADGATKDQLESLSRVAETALWLLKEKA